MSKSQKHPPSGTLSPGGESTKLMGPKLWFILTYQGQADSDKESPVPQPPAEPCPPTVAQIKPVVEMRGWETHREMTQCQLCEEHLLLTLHRCGPQTESPPVPPDRLRRCRKLKEANAPIPSNHSSKAPPGKLSLTPGGRGGPRLLPGTQPTTAAGPKSRSVFGFLCVLPQLPEGKGLCLSILPPPPTPRLKLERGSEKDMHGRSVGAAEQTASALRGSRISRQWTPFLSTAEVSAPRSTHADLGKRPQTAAALGFHPTQA